MSVILIYPPQFDKKFSNPFISEPSLPPLGIASIAAYLEKFEIPVKIIDASILNLSFPQLIKILKKINPCVIGITAQTQNINRSVTTANIIKNEFPDIPIIFGGPHPTILPEETLKAVPAVDFIVIGEGEVSTLEIINAIYSNRNFESIKGIGFRKNQTIKINSPRPYIEDLNILPFPARHLLPLTLYKPNPLLYKRTPVTSAIVSRGCPYQCKFCSKTIWGNNIRERSAEKVFEEILLLKNEYNVNEIVFLDDVFTLHKKRVIEICDLILKNKVDISWSCITRVDAINRALLLSMKKSGCHQIAFGIESGNESILNLINKRITLDQVKKAFEICRKVGIETRAYFILAFPTETREMSYQTIAFAKKINPDYAYFYIYVPYPGTELWEIAEEKGQILNRDWNHFSRWDPNYIPDNRTAKEIKNTFKSAYRLFYLRLKYMANRLKAVKNIGDFRKNFELIIQYIKGMID